MSFDVSMTTTIDIGDLVGMLLDSERKVLARHEKKILNEIKAIWTDWQYVGRPANAPRLVSHDAWKTELQSTVVPFSIVILNEARTYNGGKPYVTHVHRAGVTQPEWERLFERIVSDMIPPLRADLTAEILKNAGIKRPVKKVRTSNKGSTARVGGGGAVF
jgi:hypothetical protein